MPNIFSRPQTGFAHLAILLLIAISLVAYLIQQNPNFTSLAALQTNTAQIKRDPQLGVRLGDSVLFDKALALGISKIRVSVESADIFYNETQQQKSYYTPVTEIFKAASQNSIQLLIVLKPADAISLSDLDDRLNKLSQTLPQNANIVFELGNEPNAKNANGQSYWSGDYNSFATFIKDTSIAVRKKWPSVPIIIGALDLQGKIKGSSEELGRSDLNFFLDALSQKVTLANFDFAIHAYHEVSWFNTIYNLEKSELAKRNLNPKLWLTETGVNLNEGDNPQQLVEIIKNAESKNDIKGVFIHSFDSNDGYQLWNGGPTETYKAVQNYVQSNPSSINAPGSTSGGEASPEIPFGRVGLGQSQGKEGDNAGPRSDFLLFLTDYDRMIARIKEDTRVKELLTQAEVDKQKTLLAEAEKANSAAKAANEAWQKEKTNPDLAKKASDATKAAADAIAAAESIRKLAKLEQLLQGKTTEQCIKADLGIRPWLLARRIKLRGEDTREDGSPGEKVNRYLRLYVCSGKDGKPKWRVATEGNDNTQDAQNEDSMERILRLHGDSETAPYPTPKYPFNEIEGNYVQLIGQTPDEVRISLDKYIQAAKAGKAVIETLPVINEIKI